MREIKFRYWDKERTMMCCTDSTNTFELFEIDEYVVMQFTGLKDKNGKEIYEGDVLKDYNSTFEVSWEFTRWNFKRITGAYQYPSEYSNASRMEVIGNIYENPELLKGQTNE